MSEPLTHPTDGNTALRPVPADRTAAAALIPHAEAARFEGISRREVYNRVRSGRYVAESTGEVARNGRPVKGVRLDSLSAEGQARYLASLEREQAGEITLGLGAPPPERLAEIGAAARGALVRVTETGRLDLAPLRESGQVRAAEEIERRFNAVQAFRERTAKGEKKGSAAAAVAVAMEVSVGTVRRWIKAYTEHGVEGLNPGWGARRGESDALPPPLRERIKSSYLTPQQQTVRQVYRHTVKVWCREHGRALPSYSTVRRWIERNIPPEAAALARAGKRAWEENFMAMSKRDWDLLAPNDLWCADHRRLDVFCTTPDGRIVRPWVTMFIDCHTTKIVGWRLAESPSSQTVALAMRMGIWLSGVPRVWNRDNGKEFTANRFGGKKLSTYQTREPDDGALGDRRRWPAELPVACEDEFGRVAMAQLGVERCITSIPYSSWSKTIEPVLGAFAKRWENMMPGWCGPNTRIRPERLKRDQQEGKLLNWDEMVDAFGTQVADWNAHHTCGWRTMTPNQMYAAHESDIRRVAEEDLDFLLMRRARVTVRNRGIEVGGNTYMSDELAVLVGHKVSYSYDPGDPAYIVVRPLADPTQRVVVMAAIEADPLNYGAANVLTQRRRKGQRAALRVAAERSAPYLSPTYVDPHGAWEQATRNAQAKAALENATGDGGAQPDLPQTRDPSVAPPTDRQMIEAARRQDRQEDAHAATAHASHVQGVAADILAQAAEEEAL